MSLPLPDSSAWPHPWVPVPRLTGTGSADSREAELRREVSSGHPLYGLVCKAVAWNADDPDDVLFVTNDPTMPLAFVHLMWKGEHGGLFGVGCLSAGLSD